MVEIGQRVKEYVPALSEFAEGIVESIHYPRFYRVRFYGKRGRSFVEAFPIYGPQGNHHDTVYSGPRLPNGL